MKVHTRKKRLLGLKTGHKSRFFFTKVVAKRGDKTFKTREGAEKHAKNLGLVKYEIVPAKKDRFKPINISVEVKKNVKS